MKRYNTIFLICICLLIAVITMMTVIASAADFTGKFKSKLYDEIIEGDIFVSSPK